MYQLADLDLVEIQVVGRLHGQETRNVYHYYVSAAAVIPDGRSALVTAGNDFLANTSFQFPATLDGGTDSDRCARGTTRDVLVGCEIIP